ncbi:MAG: signal recognition particle-docking protein FtsY [Rhizobiaceae bacterium]
MAFGFIKKVFSFGKKEVEERPAEDAPLKPLNFDALEALKSSEPAKPEEAAPAPEPPHPVEPQPEPEPRPDIPEPTPEPEIPAPGPDLPPPAEEPALPERAPELPEPPAASEIPQQPEPPAPSEPKPARDDIPVSEAPPPEAMVELGPAQTRKIPQTPETSERPSVDEAPPTHPAPKPDQPSPQPAPSPDIPAPEKPAKLSEAPEPRSEIPAPIEPPDEPWAANREPVSGETTPHPPAGALSPSLRDKDKGEARSVEQDRPEASQAPSAPKPPAGRVTVSRKVEQKAELAPPAGAAAPRQSWFQRMRAGLSRSSRELSSNIAGIFTKRRLDEDALQDLEDVLIRADLGIEAAMRITDSLASGRYGKDVSDVEVRRVMAAEVEKVLGPVALPLELDLSHKPHVILVVGVNGTGKTTTIGKLAAKLTAGGLSVMLAAGDTFRAAAIEQLKIWGERTHSPVISSKLGADAAGLAFDAFQQAKEAGSDVLIIDTAGRLQNKAELMAELEKIVRVLGRLDPEAPHTVLQTIDATTGQNALIQVEIFRNVAGVNGLVLTKLDGTARGGILVAIAAKHKLPVYFIGVGEQVDDLEPFSAKEFAEAIAGTG